MTGKISLKAAIVNSGVSQKYIAQELNLTTQGICQKIKRYKVMRAKDLAKICKIIHFDMNDLDFDLK